MPIRSKSSQLFMCQQCVRTFLEKGHDEGTKTTPMWAALGTKKLKPAAPLEVAYYRVFGKEAGAGTDVTLNNSALLGTAEVIPYDASTGTTAASDAAVP